jgi:type II secretory pathway pseudopilin PulG
MTGERGYTVAEMVVVLALWGALLAMALPSLSELLARSRMQGAVRELVTELRAARSRALAESRSIGFRFEAIGTGWIYTLHADGDGDGVRVNDIAAGIDPRLGQARSLSQRWEGVDLGFLDLGRIRRLPPAAGWMDAWDDPVQCGSSDIIAFSPDGDASSGTLYLTDFRSQMAALVLFGPTVRVRSFRYDPSLEEWVS